jgi:multidrug efflux system membrane fusion protein
MILEANDKERIKISCLSMGYVGLLMASLVLLLDCSNGPTQPDQKSNQSAVPVTVATVIQKDVPVQLQAIGNVEAYSTVSVKSQVEGQLAHVYFEEGDEVRKGELIFLIDPRPFEASLKQAQANMARDVTQMKKAESDTRRYAELLKKGIVSEAEYDQYRTSFETFQATVNADSAAVENAKLQLEYCYIRSPIDGRIGRLMVNPGNIVEANQTTLVIINQIKPIYVTFSIPEQKLIEIRKYMASAGKLKVEAIISTEKDNPVGGELTFLNNQVDTTTGTILLKALFPNEDELLWPGKFVNVALTLTTINDAVVIPSEAVQTGQEGEYVFVVKSDLTVESRPVIIGGRLDQDVVIAEGLQPEEKVVTNGQHDLAPGVKVEVKNRVESNTQNNSGLTKQKGRI